MNFNYNTLNVTLHRETRSIHIELNRPEVENAINVEMLFELESLYSWLTAHLEVNAVVLSGSGEIFCSGFDKNELKIMSEEKLKKYMTRFQKLVAGLLYLPQTVICDLKEGASGMGIELALGADLRISSSTSKVKFDSLQKGWVPCNGGIGLLTFWVGHANARAWTLRSKNVSASEMLNSGFISETYYSNENALKPILESISLQAPIARIQTKRSFLETILPELQRSFEYETIFSFAALKTGDWAKENDENFTAARDLARELKKRDKETLI